MGRVVLYTVVFILTLCSCFSQEALKPLNANLSYIYRDLAAPKHAPFSATTLKPLSGSILLPFIDDFSYADTSHYPDPNKWTDSTVYVNTGFPVRPPSIGVATFDGLNKYGYPYQPNLANLSLSLPADTLTSRPVNLFTTATSQTLQPSDSIALSFYYQARGYGEAPELNDSLIVDFFKPGQNLWVNNVWYKLGNASPNVNDTNFKYAFIWISDTAYLKDGFKFRFRAKASPTGSFDNWHLDYVNLDKSMSQLTAPNYKDLTFAYVPTPFLQYYSAMPYEQYSVSDMATKNLVKIKNNFNQSLNVTYESRFYDATNSQVHFYTGSSNNLAPFATGGYSSFSPHSNPSFNYTFPGGMPDSIDYKIEHLIYESQTSGDFINENNKVIQYQRFRNYYALDDGSAEAGYYINTTGGKIAVKIVVNVPDSFLAVRVYIDPVGKIQQSENSKGFRIVLWSGNNNGPGAVISTDTIFKPRYYTDKSHNQFSEYKLFRPKLLAAGVYFVGIQQLAIENPSDIITVGFDRNTDHRTSIYYDAGSGWTQSNIPGSVMIRPVFGKTLPPPVGIYEKASSSGLSVKVYPNPASGQITLLSAESLTASYSITNAMGLEICNGVMSGKVQDINTEHFTDGIYFLTLKTGSRLVQQSKLIIQH